MAPLQNEQDESLNTSSDSVRDSKWEKLFPKCVGTREASATFMTRALYVAYSVILNRRGLLNQDCFTKTHVAERLKCDTLCFKNPRGLLISTLLKNAGAAIKQGFLKEFSLVITDADDAEEAIEVYSFRFHYFENGEVAADFTSKADKNATPPEPVTPLKRLKQLRYEGSETVRDQIIMLVRSIIYLCQKVLTDLPAVRFANFRTSYTDEAPEGYTIDGFTNTEVFYTLPKEIESATLGHLRPGHHGGVLECASIFMEDAYKAETGLKRHIAKVAEQLGFQANDTLYSTMETDSPMVPANTRSDAAQVESQSSNGTIENLSEILDSSSLSSPRSSTRTSTRRGNGRAAPYNKTRGK